MALDAQVGYKFSSQVLQNSPMMHIVIKTMLSLQFMIEQQFKTLDLILHLQGQNFLHFVPEFGALRKEFPWSISHSITD